MRSSSCYLFDPESSLVISKGGSRNQSNTVVIDPSSRAGTRSDFSTTRRVLERMRRLLTCRLFPAGALVGLVLWQLGALIAELREFNLHPGWIVLGECLRSVLYALFLCFPIGAFLTHEPPRSRDGRVLVKGAAVVATFLLAGLGLLVPSGIQLWRMSSAVVGIAVAITLVGVVLAVTGAHSLGANFSFGPQGRALVVRGPYRMVRHPIYLAELAMIVGVTIVSPRVVPLVGATAVIVLQLVRIRAEERLLRSTFPGFSRYAAVTRYRLVPFLW